jgi:hypothetical protein
LRVTSRGLGDVYKRQADNVAAKVAELKKLPYFVDLVPRGGSRKRRQSKKRRNHKNHNNDQ